MSQAATQSYGQQGSWGGQSAAGQPMGGSCGSQAQGQLAPYAGQGYQYQGLQPFTGAQPTSEASQYAGEYAPVGLARSNDYLAHANRDNAYWNPEELLPNANFTPFGSISGDGLYSEDGPTFAELAIYTPNLLDAAVASRHHFMSKPQITKNINLGLRPDPYIPSADRTSIPWNVSSIQQSDSLPQFDAYTRTFGIFY